MLRRANVDRTLMKDIVKKQITLFGHVIMKEELENLVVTGFIEKKRARGRQRDTYLTYLQNINRMTPIELIHLAYESMSGYSCPNSSLHQYDMTHNDDDITQTNSTKE